MNLIGRRYPGPGTVLSNNADARSVQVRVMNKRTPTTVQAEETGRMFESYIARIATSLAGFHQHNGRLSDGSEVRIVSNSGMHVIQIWPAGGEQLVELVEDFWGIPADSVTVNGTQNPLSGTWRLALDDLAMPPALKQKRPYLPSANPTHPGHLIWSSADFKADKQEVVLGWRGPRDRYAATTGWSTAAGGTQVAHNNAGTNIGDQVFKDSPYLWISGRKVLTPITRVIAAAIHCPDPIGAPGMSVLRVLTDNISNDGTTRKVGCKDLVPTGETGPVNLGRLLNAETYIVLNTYTAALNGNGTGAGEWQMWQRPHFDHNGARIATTIKFGATGMWSMVSLDAQTFAILEQYDCTSTRVQTSNKVTTDTGAGSNPRTTHIEYQDELDTTNIMPLACDFLGANFVRMWVDQRRKAGALSIEDRTNNSGTVTEHHDTHIAAIYGVTVRHSQHGVILTDTQDRSHLATYDFPGSHPGGTASFPGLLTPAYSAVSFVGNLARDAFAVGYRVADGDDTAAATTAKQSDGTTIKIYALTSKTTSVRPMTFRIWMDGIERASGTTGSFTNPADSSGTPTTGVLAVCSENRMEAFLTGSLGTPPPAGTTVAVNSLAYNGTRAGGQFFDPAWAHIAINAKRTFAYFGFFLNIPAAPPSVPETIYGLEQAWFHPPDQGYTSAPVPVYSPGARPTISAPVFPGVTRKELVP